MAKTAAFIELPYLTQDGQVADDACAQINRMHNSNIGLCFVSQQDQALEQANYNSLAEQYALPSLPVYGLSSDSPDAWHWPRPGQILRACKEQEYDIFTSWMIGATPALFEAAAQAGFLGGIFIGVDKPEGNMGLQVFNQAESVGDAPRVMIPPDGGCWHNH